MKKTLTVLSLLIFMVFPPSSGAFYQVNDEYYDYQDYLKKINYFASNYRNNEEGEGVVVAVIDSGVWQSHPDLYNRIWTNTAEIANNGIDDDNNGYVDDYYGYNFINDNHSMITYSSHGTAVAGIIAANRDDNGILGIANKAKIMPLIACDDSGCPDTSIKSAIKYAADNGADIINLSLGGINGYTSYSTSYDYYIKYAYDRDVVIVAAAGNGDVESAGILGLNLNVLPGSPVCNNNGENMVLGVGANDASWSNYGSNCVDVTAPGVDIATDAVPAHDEYGWKYFDGTSFSTPMVAATAAVIKSMDPSLKNYEIIDIIINNSVAGKLDVDASFSLDQSNTSIEGLDKTNYSTGEKITVTGEHFSDDIDARLRNSSGSYNAAYIKSVKLVDQYTVEILISDSVPEGDYNLELLSSKIFNGTWKSTNISILSNSAPSETTQATGNVIIPSGLYSIEGLQGSPVYMIGDDGKKYVFPDSKTYFTWYKDFDDVVKVSTNFLDNYDDGGTVAYKPGTKLVTHMNTAKIYAVTPGNVLRQLPSAEVAENLYGSNWYTRVQDVLPGFFSASYTVGEPLSDKLPNRTIITSSSSNEYYIIEDSYKRKFSNTSILESHGYSTEDAVVVNDLNSYPDGEVISQFESVIGYYMF